MSLAVNKHEIETKARFQSRETLALIGATAFKERTLKDKTPFVRNVISLVTSLA